MNLNIMLIFDVIIGMVGAYMLYSAQKMKRTNEVPELFVTQQEMKQCRNKLGFLNFLYNKVITFSVVCILFGLEGLYSDIVYDLGKAVNSFVIIIFIGAWIWFSHQLKKGKEEFF